MSRGLRRALSGLPVAALGALCALAAAPTAARALSFTLPAGSRIIDIDLSGGSQGLAYDGDNETLSLSGSGDAVDVDRFDLKLSDGSLDTIEFGTGQVRMQLNIALDPPVQVGTSTMEAHLSNGSVSDFTVWDLGGSTTELVFAGSFVDDLVLEATQTVLGLQANLGSSTYRIDSEAPEVADALLDSGTLNSSINQFRRNGSNLTGICQIVDAPCPPDDGTASGLQSFTAQPNLDFTPVPEPSTLALLAGGLAGLAGGRRRPSAG